jgi:low affinity Fe/Cu permease
LVAVLTTTEHPIDIGVNMANPGGGFTGWFEGFSQRVTHATGRPWAFLVALGVILTWGLTGPIFGFNDTWQLVINTGTTIVTFLMVFLIQQTQNKDNKAIELKLNELVAATQGASDRLIDIEDLSEDEMDILHTYYRQLADLARRDGDLTESHSLDDVDPGGDDRHGSRGRISDGREDYGDGESHGDQ